MLRPRLHLYLALFGLISAAYTAWLLWPCLLLPGNLFSTIQMILEGDSLFFFVALIALAINLAVCSLCAVGAVMILRAFVRRGSLRQLRCGLLVGLAGQLLPVIASLFYFGTVPAWTLPVKLLPLAFLLWSRVWRQYLDSSEGAAEQPVGRPWPFLHELRLWRRLSAGSANEQPRSPD